MSAFKFSLEFCILVLDDFVVRGRGELEVTKVGKLAYFSGCILTAKLHSGPCLTFSV